MSLIPATDIILEGVDLKKHFGGGGLLSSPIIVRAVDGVSLRIRRGETFAVVGESGCGKSTLGRLLLRLIEPTGGDVRFEGRSILSLNKSELRRLRRELQIIFQDPFASLNPRMNVGDIIAEPIWLHNLASGREKRERVADLMATVGLLPTHSDRYPHELSGGQRQRIGIARALAGDPKLIIGDEPVSALDVSIQAQIINLLEDLKDRFGLTLVIVAHDLAVIRHMSDRVAVMYLGEIAEVSDTDALFDDPLHPYTQALLAAIPATSPRNRQPKASLQGDVPNPAAPPSGCRFHTRCPHARALCKEQHPILETAALGRQVACHFWREIQGAGAGSISAPPPTPALARRLELYRIWRERQDKPATTSP
ncbi:oligopeptide ABC transporter ATP-binding protein [Agaricicola taiwanensis]|uniref:Oligopeptide ABC transporter ATP-binding protein n=1 Tax=Agaricicola taiwanensis TaxID=591372 RepID=A0A8J3DY94_9RHOB|nr:oligopeptide/dipeptide ABC transporter ATP-binding protein [Agaricicola taiwanensis]GGE49733.1 oligopeptide ABC transporter ATP-binding protein [Agaricicola taiwanensis]